MRVVSTEALINLFKKSQYEDMLDHFYSPTGDSVQFWENQRAKKEYYWCMFKNKQR